MKHKVLILGLLLIVAGMVARLVPHVNTGLSPFTILEILGIVLVFVTIVRNWGAIRNWVRARSWGRQFRFVCGFLLLAVCFQCGWAVYDEIEGGKEYDEIEKVLERKDPEAALALAAMLGREENGPLRVRLIERIAELGRPSHSAIEVTAELLRRLREDPENSVREAAAKALPAQMDRIDILRLFIAIPDMDERSKPLAVAALETRTGKVFGEDSSRWVDWIGATWCGAEGDEAYAMAEFAYRNSESAASLLPVAALARLAEGTGVSEDRLLAMAEDADPTLRGVGAAAIGTAEAKGLLLRLVKILKSEKSSFAASAQASTIAELDRPSSWNLLLEVARSGAGEVCRKAAMDALASRLGSSPGLELSHYMARVYRKLPKGSEKEGLFKRLLGMAVLDTAAQRELAILFGDPKIKPWDRIRSLKKLQEVDASQISKEMLIEVSREDTDPELIKFAKQELERR